MIDSDKPAVDEQADADVFAVSAELVRAVDAALLDVRTMDAWDLVADLHAADLADVIEMLPRDRRRELVVIFGARLDARVLTELEGSILGDVLEQLEPRDLARAIGELDTDDAVYLIESLSEERREHVLHAVPAPDRAAMREALSYPEDSAGRLMQREMIAVPAFWTVGQVIDYCRETADLPEEFYEIFVVDPRHRPVGQVPLNRALRSKRPVLVRDIMESEIRSIPMTLDQEEVAFLFRQYRMASAPVVDNSGRLVGVITFDDVAEVIEDEAEEDFMKLAGVSAETDVRDPILLTTRTRFAWLLVNLFTAIVASLVIGLFDATIEQMVALAVLMPIVASMGGNAGTQTLTITVRALATREMTPANAMRIVWKESVVGGINGVLFALLMGVIAALWFQSPPLGLVIGAAMTLNLLIAGFCGTVIPLACQRFGVDPAVAASIFLTTVTDVVGFIAFLGLAALFLL